MASTDRMTLLELLRKCGVDGRAEKTLLAVVQEAYVHGVSTRKVDELVEALGMRGISKSEVSRICKELDGVVHNMALVGAILLEQQDEWSVGRRYFSLESMRQLTGKTAELPAPSPAFQE